MIEKRCFKCGQVQPLDAFYTHPRMADGRLNKCKSCTKADVAAHRDENHAKVCAYDRERAKRPERRANSAGYRRTIRSRDPEKARCRRITAYALRTGKLVPKPCVHCGTGESIEAHHPDYSRPLDVVWCCFKCHREVEHGQRVEAA